MANETSCSWQGQRHTKPRQHHASLVALSSPEIFLLSIRSATFIMSENLSLLQVNISKLQHLTTTSGLRTFDQEVPLQRWTDELGRLRVAAQLVSFLHSQNLLGTRSRPSSIGGQIQTLLRNIDDLVTDLDGIVSGDSDAEILPPTQDDHDGLYYMTEMQEIHLSLARTVSDLYQLTAAGRVSAQLIPPPPSNASPGGEPDGTVVLDHRPAMQKIDDGQDGKRQGKQRTLAVYERPFAQIGRAVLDLVRQEAASSLSYLPRSSDARTSVTDGQPRWEHQRTPHREETEGFGRVRFTERKPDQSAKSAKSIQGDTQTTQLDMAIMRQRAYQQEINVVRAEMIEQGKKNRPSPSEQVRDPSVEELKAQLQRLVARLNEIEEEIQTLSNGMAS